RAAIGDEIRRRFAAGDLPGARRWLDWAREEAAEGDALRVLWPAEREADETPNADRIRLAAAAVPGAPQASLEILGRAPETPPRRVDEAAWTRAVRDAERRALVEAGLGDPAEPDTVGIRDRRAVAQQALARLAADELAEAEAALADASASDPADGLVSEPMWWRAVAALHLERGDLDTARTALLTAVSTSGAPQIEDSFLIGRLAEACGLDDVARDLYARVLADRGMRDREPELRRLTERRLARLVGARTDG
ncbi:MAG: hypothetical protein AAGE94_14920, partial [Acidobacteriota bacterium]